MHSLFQIALCMEIASDSLYTGWLKDTDLTIEHFLDIEQTEKIVKEKQLKGLCELEKHVYTKSFYI